MNIPIDFEDAFARCPLIAILRGVGPEEVEAVGSALVDGGFSLIEVPLNSPDPLLSISRLARHLGGRAVVGAGTVLETVEVKAVQAAGGRFIVSPNTDSQVIGATIAAGLASLPGYFTPTEALRALAAGAHMLKLFPAEAASPTVLRAHRAILPANVPVLVVGGVTTGAMEGWFQAGATGFGLGSALYRAGAAPLEVFATAVRFVECWKQLTAPPSA